MDQASSADNLDQHLSQISTTWTVLLQAHASDSDRVCAAQRQLLHRYHAAVYRYLLAAVRDRDAADDLFQDFALRFVRGDFKRADPQRGRFRDFLKTSLYHLIVDHQRRRQRTAVSLAAGVPEPAVEPPRAWESDQEFLAIWKAELMARAWEGLARVEQETGQPLHTVLRFRTDHPDVRAPEMAIQLQPLLGKTVTPEWVRKRLFFARERFTDLLVEEVAQSLEHLSEEALVHELAELGLLEYCKGALGRRSRHLP